MARPGKVWWNSGKQAWYSTIAGKKTRVADGDKTREQAEELWHQMHAKESAADVKDRNPLRLIFELFMDDIEKQHPPSLRGYRRVLQTFLDFHRDPQAATCTMRACDLTAAEVGRWLLSRDTWSDATKGQALSVLQAALNWAAQPERRLITANPIAGMERPAPRSRGEEAYIDPGDEAALFDAARPALRNFLFALRQTGARPSSLRRVTAADCHLDRSCIVLHQHKTRRKTGRPLMIPVSPALTPLIAELCAKHPEGPIFRTATCRPWVEGSLRKRFQELRSKLKGKLKGHPIMYGYRHTTATDWLMSGVPDAKVAFGLGHADTKMIYHHYGHLGRHVAELAEELGKALNGSGGTAPPPPTSPLKLHEPDEPAA